MEPKRFCTNCGVGLVDGAAFCESCGTLIVTLDVDNKLTSSSAKSDNPTLVTLDPANAAPADQGTVNTSANPLKVWAIILIIAVIVGAFLFFKPWSKSGEAESNDQSNSQDQQNQDAANTESIPALFQGEPAAIPPGTVTVNFPSYSPEVGFNICKDSFRLGDQILTPAVANNTSDPRHEEYQKIVTTVRRGLASIGLSQSGNDGDEFLQPFGGFDVDTQNAIYRYQTKQPTINGKTEPARYIRPTDEPLIGTILWDNMKGWLTRYNQCQSYKSDE